MSNNLTIKDGLGVSKEIHTIEDSTSAHYNMSIPITVSGVPIFTTAAPGIVSVHGGQVSIAPQLLTTHVSNQVSIAPQLLLTHVCNSFVVSVADKVSVAGRVSAHQDGTWIVNVSNEVSLAPQTILAHVCNTHLVRIVHSDGALAAVGAPIEATGAIAGLYTNSHNLVFNRASNTWDLMTGTSVGIAVLPVSIASQILPVHVSNNVSLAPQLLTTHVSNQVSIAPQTLIVHVCNARSWRRFRGFTTGFCWWSSKCSSRASSFPRYGRRC